jgi:hypothetical protein
MLILLSIFYIVLKTILDYSFFKVRNSDFKIFSISPFMEMKIKQNFFERAKVLVKIRDVLFIYCHIEIMPLTYFHKINDRKIVYFLKLVI